MAKQRVCIEPQGRWIEVNEDESLRDALFREGVEFPCGGKGRCGGCRVQLLEGQIDPSPIEIEYFTPEEITTGWRFACRTHATDDLRIHIDQWDTPILDGHSDDSDSRFNHREGYGIAVDLGTTTIVAQLLNLSNGEVMGVAKSLNPQGAHGADLMSRIEFASLPEGFTTLVDSVRNRIGFLVKELVEANKIISENIDRIVVVGNTAMAHLFCRFDIAALARVPFESKHIGLHKITVSELGWYDIGCNVSNTDVWVLPLLGGFVGGDILAGILSINMHQRSDVVMLIDIGTNGEIVIGNRDRILCASTAAGPAFEGGGVKMGMYASTGAIDAVEIVDEKLKCHVIGGGKRAKGICGSGLVDAVAACLDLDLIEASGRITSKEKEIALTKTVELTQQDIRQLQLAKGSIASGIQVLIDEYSISKDEINTVYLAGAFGNYINVDSAFRIGLIEFAENKIVPAGNTALHGAKLALGLEASQEQTQAELNDILTIVEHIALGESQQFQQLFIEATVFPKESI